MSLPNKLLRIVDVLLRVPPLFIIDELLRIGLGLPQYDSAKETLAESEGTQAAYGFQVDSLTNFDSQFYKFLLITFMKFIISLLGKFSWIHVFSFSVFQSMCLNSCSSINLQVGKFSLNNLFRV